MRPQFHFMVGIPGSGKSTIVPKIFEKMRRHGIKPVVLSSDDLFDELAAKENTTYDDVFHNRFMEISEKFQNQFRDRIVNRRTIILDRTSIDTKSRLSVLKNVPAFYEIHYHIIMPPVDVYEEFELKRRLANRPGKTISDEVMQEFRGRFAFPDPDNEPIDSITAYSLSGAALYTRKGVDADIPLA